MNRIDTLRNLRGVPVFNVCFSCGVLYLVEHSHLYSNIDTRLNYLFKRVFKIIHPSYGLEIELLTQCTVERKKRLD